MNRRLTAAFFVFGLTLIGAMGCSQNATTPAVAGEEKTAHEHSHADHADSKKHDHSGWWCDAHGVPEEVCGQCDSKVAAACQKKGDWCQTHERPDSQCFTCHPELEVQFAERYEAKFGTKPPKPQG